jgi:hypothetical protein
MKVKCYYSDIGLWFMMEPRDLKHIVDYINEEISEEGFMSVYHIMDLLNMRKPYGNGWQDFLGFDNKVRVKLIYINMPDDPRVLYLRHDKSILKEKNGYPF